MFVSSHFWQKTIRSCELRKSIFLLAFIQSTCATRRNDQEKKSRREAGKKWLEEREAQRRRATAGVSLLARSRWLIDLFSHLQPQWIYLYMPIYTCVPAKGTRTEEQKRCREPRAPRNGMQRANTHRISSISRGSALLWPLKRSRVPSNGPTSTTFSLFFILHASTSRTLFSHIF